MTDTLEWDKRADYALTELVLFILASLVIVIAITLSFALVFLNLDGNQKFISTLRPLFENVLPAAIAFTPVETEKKTAEVNIVFLGRQEREKKKRITRKWVHLYFVLLCFLIVFWAVATFSSSVLYRKSTSCTDLDVEDTDLSCFLLSNEDVPEGIQQIIDEEKGDLVPCDKVEEYIDETNSTFDLEIICYQYVLNPLAAAGIAYGAMKTIAFVIMMGLNVIFIFTKKYRDRLKGNEFPDDKILVAQAVQLFLSFMVIALIIIVIALLHAITSTKNSAFDYLRGEKFYNFSVTVLASVTIVFTLGLFPWWAFEPLEDLTQSTNLDRAIVNDRKKVTKAFHLIVHKAILHQKFSTGIASLLKMVGDIAGGQHDQRNDNSSQSNQQPQQLDGQQHQGNGNSSQSNQQPQQPEQDQQQQQPEQDRQEAGNGTTN